MASRRTHIDTLRDGFFDVLVVGGGINGAVTSAALAGRGASVALIDRGDFGNFTSQESSNLVWGGFKYLENYELLLVFKLCRSRNRLMKAYPDNIKEISFLASLDRTSPYPPWFAALGALGYWIIGQFGTRYPRLLSKEKIRDEEPVINTGNVRGGIEYRDAYLIDNDCRFVFSFVRSALEAGATAANYVELVSAERKGDRWVAQLRDVDSGEEFTTSAKVLVNAAGPFVDTLNNSWGARTDHRIVYSKGIHLVVPRLTTDDHQRVLAFFDDTQRLFYVIPMGSRSVIGTTDTRIDEAVTHVTDEDRQFLLSQINARLNLDTPLTTADIIAERCGVPPAVVHH
ncbi:MAG: FAD-dependent oxidoreductase, partial [Ilumatobacteraceae bacterium]